MAYIGELKNQSHDSKNVQNAPLSAQCITRYDPGLPSQSVHAFEIPPMGEKTLAAKFICRGIDKLKRLWPPLFTMRRTPYPRNSHRRRAGLSLRIVFISANFHA